MGVRVAVVGGSLSGCIAASQLGRAGHRVDVYERAKSPLVGRGASIVLQQPLFERCQQLGLITDRFAYNRVTKMEYLTRDGDGERWLGTLRAGGAAMTWSDLYAELRSHVPDERYHVGALVDSVSESDDAADLHVSGQPLHPVDLAVFADGYRSMGREIIDPHARTSPGDVALIRGIVPEAEGDDRLAGRIVRVLYPGGHGIFYLIPGEDGSMEPGRRRVSCSFYLPPDAADVSYRSADGGARDIGSLVDSATPLHGASSVLDTLRDALLPSYFSGLLRRTSEFYVQPIFSVTVARHAARRICLVGDAGSVFPPYSNSGVLKAVSNVGSLVAALDRGSIGAALGEWDAEQDAADREIHDVSERFATDLIRDVPDFRVTGTGASNDFLRAVHPGLTLDLPESA